MTPDKDPIKLAIDALEKANFKLFTYGFRNNFFILDAIKDLQSQPAPAVTDLDDLKRGSIRIADGKRVAGNEHDKGWNDCIDQLAATGRIAGDTIALQAEIAELKQALSGRTVSCDACNGWAQKRRELIAAVQGFSEVYKNCKPSSHLFKKHAQVIERCREESE